MEKQITQLIDLCFKTDLEGYAKKENKKGTTDV